LRRSSRALVYLPPDLAMAEFPARLGAGEDCGGLARSAARREIAADLEQHIDQPTAVIVAQARKCLLPVHLAERPHALEHGRHFVGRIEPARTAIREVGAPLDPARGLQPIDQA